jgi:hypothetical protein
MGSRAGKQTLGKRALAETDTSWPSSDRYVIDNHHPVVVPLNGDPKIWAVYFVRSIIRASRNSFGAQGYLTRPSVKLVSSYGPRFEPNTVCESLPVNQNSVTDFKCREADVSTMLATLADQ